MKRFYSVVNSVVFLQRKQVLRSSYLLNECNQSCKIVKNCILSHKNTVSYYCLPQSLCIKSIKGCLTHRQICWQDSVNLSNKKNRLDFLFWPPFLTKESTYRLQRVNWLPTRTILPYNRPLQYKIKFRRCPINLMN